MNIIYPLDKFHLHPHVCVLKKSLSTFGCPIADHESNVKIGKTRSQALLHFLIPSIRYEGFPSWKQPLYNLAFGVSSVFIIKSRTSPAASLR